MSSLCSLVCLTRMNGEAEMTTAQWLHRVVDLLENSGFLEPSRDQPVVNFMHPSQLKKSFDLSLNESPLGQDAIEKLCEYVIKHSVKTAHPHFHNQLYGAYDPYGLVGSIITEALNTNQYTYEVAPTFTLTEHEVVKKTLSLVGYQDGDGIFGPGGSMSNMYGMVLARYKLAPETKTKGMHGLPPLVAFMSQDAHYSITKGVNWLGIGTDNLIKVKADSNGRMIPEDLKKQILKVKADGKSPFFVNATLGTTVLGAIDPIEEIASICKEFGLWLHVDACWGGSLLLSKRFAEKLKCISQADSVSWNPHKMLGAPLQCSAFLTKHKGLLHQCNCAAATYLFQQDKFYDVSFDTGDKSVQCGRKVDAFKLWLLWKARGDIELGQLVDNAMNLSLYFKENIRHKPGFKLVIQDFDCTNVCFWYIPERLRGKDETEEWWQEVDKVAPKIKEKLTFAGTLMIGYQPLTHRGLKNFLRMVVTCHPIRHEDDMNYVIEQIDHHGKDL